MPVEVKPLEKFVRKPPSACDTDTDSPSHLSAIHFTRDSPGSRVCLTAELIESVTGARRASSAETFLDDFLLTHSIFLPSDQFQHLLLQQFVLDKQPGGVWFSSHVVDRKKAVLGLAIRYLDTYGELLQDGVKTNGFPKDLYLCAMEHLELYPELLEDVLKLQRWTNILQSLEDAEKDKKKKPVRPLFRHFRRSDACLQPCKAFRGSDEIFCRVYSADHSYVTIRSRLSCRVAEILALVQEKLQYNEEQQSPKGSLRLVSVTSSGEKSVFRLSDEAVFTALGVNTHLFACEAVELEALLPLPDEISWSPNDSKLHDMSAEEVAAQLLSFHWELFSCIHEVEFVGYVFHGDKACWRPLNLELVLQRCSEVQHWVATEILQCQSLPKRVQLLRKFIKIACLCKQHQDLMSFLALVLGLGNPAVSRLRHTWESLPGKFRKQFQHFEAITDPSWNHKTYRGLLASLQPPIIPFTPLLLKDLTFLHESCKTFQGEIVNFEKMHKVAEMVRSIRRYRSVQPADLDMDTSVSHLQTKAYVRQLQVIDNQNLLFIKSCKLEPGEP